MLNQRRNENLEEKGTLGSCLDMAPRGTLPRAHRQYSGAFRTTSLEGLILGHILI